MYRLLLLALLCGSLSWVAGCGTCTSCDTQPTGGGVPQQGAVPDFLLADVNDTSATAGQLVSPRHHVGRISAWYFGHAT